MPNSNKINLKNGDMVEGALGWCALCNLTFGGSMTVRQAKYLDGKFYHLECYPAAVDVFLADKKLEDHEKTKNE